MSKSSFKNNSSTYFQTFLEKYRVSSGDAHSHTCMGKPVKGSFNIPEDELDSFYKKYERAFNADVPLSLIEKHKDVSPILVDLDLRYDSNECNRLFTDDHMKLIVRYYIEEIRAIFDLKDKVNEVIAFVFQRDYPYAFVGKRSIPMDKYLENKNSEASCGGDIGTTVEDEESVTIKDGIHIMFPYIVSEPDIQYLLRDRVLKRCQEDKFMSDIKLKHYNYAEIIDRSIIEKNGWLMYGSSKPGLPPYALKHVFDINLEELDWMNGEVDFKDQRTGDDINNIARFFSIRRYTKNDCQRINKEMMDELGKIYKKQRTTKVRQLMKQGPSNFDYDIKIIEKLVDILDVSRAEDYYQWMEVGWCLHNIDPSNVELLSIWDNFSKRCSDKYRVGECENRWNNFKSEGFGKGSLHFWARQDNEEAYMEIKREDIQYYIGKSINNTNVDIARVLFAMYSEEFVCTDFKNNVWYQFKNHFWRESKGGIHLRSRISNQLYSEYIKVIHHYNLIANSDDITDEEREDYLEKIKMLHKITLSLKTTNYKENVMKECRELFYKDDFIDQLDDNPYLMGFENGIYDLNEGIFRNGRPEDYVSYSTKIDYKKFDMDHEHIGLINDMLEQIYPDKDVREYIWLVWASCLQGINLEQKFRIMAGSGANGKSIINTLVSESFGDYANKFPITLFTQKRAKSNVASPEVVEAKGKRYCYVEEPEENEKFNVGLLKEYSGNDKVKGRGLYKADMMEFKPQWKIFMFANDKPELPPYSYSAWRRMEVVDHPSRFEYEPKEKNEYKRDDMLGEKILKWRQAFMFLLTNVYYRKYRALGGIKVPGEVKKHTLEYQRESDIYGEFLEQYIKKLPDNAENIMNGTESPNPDSRSYNNKSVEDAYRSFTDWAKDNCANKTKAPMSSNEFKKYLNKAKGIKIRNDKLEGYYVIKYSEIHGQGYYFSSGGSDPGDVENQITVIMEQ